MFSVNSKMQHWLVFQVEVEGTAFKSIQRLKQEISIPPSRNITVQQRAGQVNTQSVSEGFHQQNTLLTWGVGGADSIVPYPARGQSETGQPGSHQLSASLGDRPGALTRPGPDSPSATLPVLGSSETTPGKHRSELWHSLCSHLSRSADKEEDVS